MTAPITRDTYMDKNGLTKNKPSLHIAQEIMKTLELQYSNRYSIIREMSIVDPEESILSMAYYYKQYPEYYAKAMNKRGISLGSLPDVSNFVPGQVPTSRRIDALMIGGMDGYGEYPKTAIEIKTSRADFRKDTDAKRKAWFAVTNRFVYLVPEGLITPNEVPQGCGLWYWRKTEYQNVIDIVKRAEVRHNVDEFDNTVLPYLLRRTARAETRLRAIYAAENI